jgi:uncharacterized protein (TIGR00369 family)
VTTRLDEMKMLMTGERPMPPSSTLLGIKVIDVQEGSTTLEMQVEERFFNRGGGVQGGFLAALADATMGTTLGTVCETDETHATLEFKLSFLRPANKDSSPLRSQGHLLYRGRRFAHTDAEIRAGNGDLIAKATASWIISKSVGKKPPPERD